ncbi:MAG: ABC transporter ATP-binding protein [Pseudomonadota bacterium]|nr:ABC transporter ATP-binding protein [Pseudomonadota bacterium]
MFKYNNIVKVKNLTKHFKNETALNNISFNLKYKETLGILGPNGSGKSTTIGILLGLIKASSGDVVIDNININSKHRTRILEKINFASPYTELPKRLSVRQNLEIYARLYNVVDIKKRLEEIFQYFNLEKLLNKKVGELSSGQKTRVSLAKALLNKPKLLLLDEPTASLDPVTAEFLREFIINYKKKNDISIIFSSHNMLEVERLCDQILFLRKGRILLKGTVVDILSKNKKSNLQKIYFDLFNK